MFRRMLLVAMITSPFTLMPARAAGQEPAPVSEDSKTRLSKQEIIDLMIRAASMPHAQQQSRMDLISKGQAASKTRRSDFLFCMGLAYLGNAKAQTCAGNAYEKGLGIVEDLSEAYTWYALALDNPAADKATEKRMQEDKERVTQRLRSSYPAPSDDDLDDMVKAQKSRIEQYQQEVKKAK